ncbi:hypothetical protein E2C01_035094 [Portunus trituberculatus]|uniref:Uncharacterized protein n=1 Tax=Portunus trituberculatus TaxID=210409 RepID=A0A5B7F394_PORTR|nr:hypothetical protein [Portunus trituberculatus]
MADTFPLAANNHKRYIAILKGLGTRPGKSWRPVLPAVVAIGRPSTPGQRDQWVAITGRAQFRYETPQSYKDIQLFQFIFRTKLKASHQSARRQRLSDGQPWATTATKRSIKLVLLKYCRRKRAVNFSCVFLQQNPFILNSCECAASLISCP